MTFIRERSYYAKSISTQFRDTTNEKHGLLVEAGDGYPCMAHFKFDHDLAEKLRTLYTQLMLERGFLAGVMIYPTLAHTDKIIERYGSDVDEVFGEIADSLSAGDVKES